jgi:protein-tyrosine phosphatase
LRVIDIHSHLLPVVDDGPKSWETAEAMCRMAANDGIEHMVATPHANDRYHYDREYLSQLIETLRQRIGDSPRLSLGCDFHLSYENLQDALSRPERYTIEGSPYLLVELSNYSIPAQLDRYFTLLGDKGLTPVITHPERNPILQQSPQRILQWIELGCAVQVTASAITGGWGARALQIAQWLLERNAVHVLATDAHDTRRRPPILSEARRKIEENYSAELAAALVDENPRAIVQGKPMPYFPDPAVKP